MTLHRYYMLLDFADARQYRLYAASMTYWRSSLRRIAPVTRSIYFSSRI